MTVPCTRRRFLLALLSAPLLTAGAAEPVRLTIEDYFLMLPPGSLEGDAPTYRGILHQSGNVLDKANGYLRCEGDGGQSNFEAALFRYRDDRPLLAVCQGDVEGADSLYLEFYVAGSGGRLRKAPRSIFPVENGAGRRFLLPRQGRTVAVRDKSGKRERRFTWDGARFVEEN